MTYTTEKILANFLSKEGGLLDKSFLDTATLFYGQKVGKLAFMAALDRCRRVNICEGVYPVLPRVGSDSVSSDNIRQQAGCWFPADLRLMRSDDGTSPLQVYRGTRYQTYCNFSDNGRSIDNMINKVWGFNADGQRRNDVWATHWETGLTASYRKAYRYLLWETLYDRVSAQDYTKPADDIAVMDYVDSILTGNPLFDRERWLTLRQTEGSTLVTTEALNLI